MRDTKRCGLKIGVMTYSLWFIDFAVAAVLTALGVVCAFTDRPYAALLAGVSAGVWWSDVLRHALIKAAERHAASAPKNSSMMSDQPSTGVNVTNMMPPSEQPGTIIVRIKAST
jgi:hypothetical protein